MKVGRQLKRLHRAHYAKTHEHSSLRDFARVIAFDDPKAQRLPHERTAIEIARQWLSRKHVKHDRAEAH